MKSEFRFIATKETILFDEIVFGPIKSRRLGLSLGINLLPASSKRCNFNCIYCECGATSLRSAEKRFHPAPVVLGKLDERLAQLKRDNVPVDTITFAGNGEPTMHPQFLRIVENTLYLRDIYFPGAKVAVLTNATMLNRQEVVKALNKADLRILKLDAGTEEMFQRINKPLVRRSLRWVVDHLHYFRNDLIIQSMFVKGHCGGEWIDNTTEAEVAAWLQLLNEIRPRQVMIYSLDRGTAESGLEGIPRHELEKIAGRVIALGINATVS
ncbi:MAG: radical SAM protein [Bacteroidota bacterium]